MNDHKIEEIRTRYRKYSDGLLINYMESWYLLDVKVLLNQVDALQQANRKLNQELYTKQLSEELCW